MYQTTNSFTISWTSKLLNIYIYSLNFIWQNTLTLICMESDLFKVFSASLQVKFTNKNGYSIRRV